MEKKNILVLTDDLWHPEEVIRRGLSTFPETEFAFDLVAAAKDIVTPEFVTNYAAVVCCKSNSVIAANNAPWFEPGVTEFGPEEMEAYVRAGGSFLAVHAGLAYTRDRSVPYTDLVGSAFIGHPPRCTVHLHGAKPHPILDGVGDFTVRDEHYRMQMLAEDADVFLMSESEAGGTQPAGYTRTLGAGRLCALTPGHTLAVWAHPAFQKLFLNALRWTMAR